MKRTALSIAVAALVLMSGCGDKKKETAAHEASVPVTKTETQAAVKPAEKRAEESVPATETPKAAAAEKPQAAESSSVSESVESVKEEARKQMQSVADSVAKGEAEANETVSAKVEEVKAQIDVTTLYTKCAGCHGMNGEKHALGKSNIIAGQSKEDLVKKIKGYQDGTYGGAMKGLMSGQVKGLSAEEVDALADYISKL